MDDLSAVLQQLAARVASRAYGDPLAPAPAVAVPAVAAVPARHGSDGRSRSRSPPPRASVPVVDLTDVIVSATPVLLPRVVPRFGPFLGTYPPAVPLGCGHWVTPLFRAVRQFRLGNAYCRTINTEHMCVGSGAEFLGMSVTTLVLSVKRCCSEIVCKLLVCVCCALNAPARCSRCLSVSWAWRR